MYTDASSYKTSYLCSSVSICALNLFFALSRFRGQNIRCFALPWSSWIYAESPRRNVARWIFGPRARAERVPRLETVRLRARRKRRATLAGKARPRSVRPLAAGLARRDPCDCAQAEQRGRARGRAEELASGLTCHDSLRSVAASVTSAAERRGRLRRPGPGRTTVPLSQSPGRARRLPS